MKQKPTRSTRAAALLLAAAALPLTPLAAQEVQPEPVTTAPPAETAAPAPAPVADPIPAPAPVAAEPAAAPAAAAPAETAPAPRAAAPRTASRTSARTPTRTATPPAPRAPAAVAPAEAPAPEAAPAEPLPAETAALPEMTPPPVPAAEAPAAIETTRGNTTLWVVAGLLLLGAIAALFLLMRRRRRDDAVYDETRSEAYDEPRYDTAMSSAAFMPEAAGIPAAAAPIAAAAAAEESGRPQLDIALHPRRAGVTGDEAKVEFELEIDNQGSAAARDVRVSTWMLPAGASSEAESMLVVRGDEAASAEVGAIAAGGEERIRRAVALPTSAVDGDAVLPVVVAEARYRLPDGSEARTRASFAVGVPDGEDFAHFAIDNPSGLHEEVEARQLGEPEHA